MSIEDETVELSLAYHGLREENVELKTLLRQYREVVEALASHETTYHDGYDNKRCIFCDGQEDWSNFDGYQHESDCLTVKARALLEPAAGE